MSQQTQPRPWFRLASMARPATAQPPPPPAPAPAPAPVRPSFLRPTFPQPFAAPPPTQAPTQQPPSPPKPQVSAPPSPPPPQAASTPPQTPPSGTKRSNPSSIPSPRPITPPLAVKPSISPQPNTPPPAMRLWNPSPNSSPRISANSVPESPKPRIYVPSSPLPTKLASPVITTNDARVLTSQVPSPRIPSYEQKIPSPKTKPLTPPPSPLTLPSPKLLHSDHEHSQKIPPEAEQKIVMVHSNTLEKAKLVPMDSNDHYNHNTNTNPSHTKKEKGSHSGNPHKKKLSDSEDIGMSVITLAGENKGATMELTPSQDSRNGHSATHHHKSGNIFKSWRDGEKFASDTEDKKKHKQKNPTIARPVHSYTNSNVQGVNNSILYNVSCTHNDPGVHLSFSGKPKDPNYPHHV